MNKLDIKNFDSLCDSIQINLESGKIEYIEFYLNEKVVLKNLKNILTGLNTNEIIEKSSEITTQNDIKPFIDEIALKIGDLIQQQKIKSMINDFKNLKKR